VSDAERLASLTGWPGRGAAGTDWAQVEARLRVALPADFRELGERFPAGVFQGYLRFNPGISHLTRLRENEPGRLRRWRDNTPDTDELEERQRLEELAAEEGWELSGEPAPEFPFPIWPEAGGIYPWALASGGATFFWLRSGRDPGSWPVVWWHGDDLIWERFDGTATGFLIALVSGQVDAARLGAPAFPPPPRFDPMVPGVPVARAD
jgi:hypothetical protein